MTAAKFCGAVKTSPTVLQAPGPQAPLGQVIDWRNVREHLPLGPMGTPIAMPISSVAIPISSDAKAARYQVVDDA